MRNGGRCFSGVLLLMEDTKREQYLRLLRSHPGSEEWTQKHMCLFLSSVDTWAAERGGTSSCPLSPCPCLYQNKTTSSFPGHPVIKVVHVLCRKRWEIQTGIKKKGKDQPFFHRQWFLSFEYFFFFFWNAGSWASPRASNLVVLSSAFLICSLDDSDARGQYITLWDAPMEKLVNIMVLCPSSRTLIWFSLYVTVILCVYICRTIWLCIHK